MPHDLAVTAAIPSQKQYTYILVVFIYIYYIYESDNMYIGKV